MKKVRQKPEDLIGKTYSTSKGGVLTVTGIVGKSKTSSNKIYSVECSICSKDFELYPKGFFTSTKGNLEAGQAPCGCSKKSTLNIEQVLILCKRVCNGRFIIHGIDGEYKGQRTRLLCECPTDGHKWKPTIDQMLYFKTGCPKCAGNPRKTPEEAHKLCVDICKEEGYAPLGFVEPYKNKYSKFKYICPRHGNKIVSLHHFVTNGTRCPECRKGNGNGYYEKRKEEQDFLYVIKFEDYIKVGRTFDLADRKRSLKIESSQQKFKVLSVYTEKHQFVYDLEQYIHSVLEGYNLDYNSGWSTETFKHESLDMVYSLIEQSNISKIK